MDKSDKHIQFDGSTEVDRFITKVELLADLKGHEGEKKS